MKIILTRGVFTEKAKNQIEQIEATTFESQDRIFFREVSNLFSPFQPIFDRESRNILMRGQTNNF